MTLFRKDIVKAIQSDLDREMTLSDIRRVLDSYHRNIILETAKGNTTTISNFGSYKLREFTGSVPTRKEKYSTKTIKFKTSTNVKKLLKELNV